MSVLVCGVKLQRSSISSFSNNRYFFDMKSTISPEKLRHILKQNKNRHRSASLTAEAALVFPFFFFSIYIFWQCFLLLLLQMTVCKEVAEVTLKSTALGYLERVSEQTEDLSWLYEPLLWEALLPEEKLDGLYVAFEEGDDGRIKGKIYYSFLCETVFFSSVRIPVVQSFSFLPYFGEYAKDRLEETTEEKQDMVYVTEHGTVYHTSKSCVYLAVEVELVSGSEIEKKRNRYGKRYTECLVCVEDEEPAQVYVSAGGSKFHGKMDCSTLKRVFEEKKKEEVTLPACSKCGGEKK